jgi:hypothetical protein
MESPTLYEPLKIKKITLKDMILENGESWGFIPTDLPKGWQEEDTVVNMGNDEGSAFKKVIYVIKNKTKDNDAIKAVFQGKPFAKGGPDEPGERIPSLDVELRIADVSEDGIITLENEDEYKINRELTLANLKRWGKGQYVQVSKSEVGYKMQNLNTENSAHVTFLNGE